MRSQKSSRISFQRLTSATKNVNVKLKNIFNEVIARIVADEIELTQFEKKIEALSESETKEKQ